MARGGQRCHGQPIIRIRGGWRVGTALPRYLNSVQCTLSKRSILQQVGRFWGAPQLLGQALTVLGHPNVVPELARGIDKPAVQYLEKESSWRKTQSSSDSWRKHSVPLLPTSCRDPVK